MSEKSRFIFDEKVQAVIDKLSNDKSAGAINGSGLGSGKAQPLDSLVLTPTGFKRMGDIEVGDIVNAPSGGVTKVTGVFPQGLRIARAGSDRPNQYP